MKNDVLTHFLKGSSLKIFLTVLVFLYAITVCIKIYSAPQNFNIDIHLSLYEQRSMAIKVTSIDSGSSYDCGTGIISGDLEENLSHIPIKTSFNCTAPNKTSKNNAFKLEYTQWPDAWEIDKSLIKEIPKDQWKEVIIKQTDIQEQSTNQFMGTHAFFSLDFSTTLSVEMILQPNYIHTIKNISYFYNSQTTWRGLGQWK
ncbi:hypothetical protein I2F27_12955 [Acinetobacter sp. B5B]|uniref:hypothetical protein n=1 Tax=Acinetobacter baretiae TaxID=2605383 RepID=UPI0018C24349|nr:hypothetical protein [Acinetobacter baretiae]MBF7684199.1 hypothetical protein [Acinetobacter baretiae]